MNVRRTVLSKCIDILNVLVSVLDEEKGGDLARRLAELYNDCIYRLYDASHQLSVQQMDVTEEILTNLHQGWKGMDQSHA